MFRNERPTYLLNLEPIKVEIFTEFTLHCNEEYSGASKCLSTYLPSISTSNKQRDNMSILRNISENVIRKTNHVRGFPVKQDSILQKQKKLKNMSHDVITQCRIIWTAR